MIYTSIRRLVEDVIEYQEDTPSQLYGMTSEREARLAHYYDRAAEEVFHARPWFPFRHATSVLTLANGQAALPSNFGSIGIDGYVVPSPAGSGQLPWVEVNYQELIAMRNNNVWPARYQQNRVYAIGPPVLVETDYDEMATTNNVGNSYRLDGSFSGNLPAFSVGEQITIDGYDDPLNNGDFIVTTVITVNEIYIVQKVSGNVGAQQISRVTLTIGRIPIDTMSILSGNPSDSRTITVYHDVTLPRTDASNGGLDAQIPFPAILHHALYAGVTWHANRSKNDRRDNEFRVDFDKALSDGIRQLRLKQNRPQQMPMSVGRMW